MTPARSPVAAGFAGLRHGKLILLLALTTALLGFVAAAPLVPTFHQTMARTLAGDHFLRNHPTFAPADFLDLLRENGSAIEGARHTAGVMGLVGVVLQIFFAGGIVVVVGRGPFGFGEFFGPARRNFWHNVKCFFLFAVAAGSTLGAWLGGGGFLRDKLVEDAPPNAAVRSVTGWLIALGALALWAVLSLLYDFARAARRYSPAIGAWRSIRFAGRALSGSWSAALRLWLFWLVLGAAALLAGFSVTWGLKAVSRPAIALLIALQFGVLWLRSAIRVAAWGSYLAFLEPRARRALAEAAPAPSTGLPSADAAPPAYSSI
ncbi:MAG TPA: hypothetical protein VMN82_10350 [Thermoanaerobaculia bacterium]|nr:hypothetical protein [Thermoanaerobaculia bacterium]